MWLEPITFVGTNSPLAIYLYHMKLIITESQKKNLLKNLIDEKGVELVIKLVGGDDNLFDLLNINSPMDFLHLFDNLEQVKSKKEKNWILFKNKSNHVIMGYDVKFKIVYVDYNEVWLFLLRKFNLGNKEIRDLMKEWLSEVYNLKDVMVRNSYGTQIQDFLDT